MKDKTTCNRNARRTRALVEGAFLELMKEKPYTKISVREITEKADINRSTFYLHYQDIYDLLGYIFREEADATLEKYSVKGDWKGVFLDILSYLKKKKKMIEHVYYSSRQEELEFYIQQVVGAYALQFIEIETAGQEVSKHVKQTVADFYRNAFVGATFQWVREGMKTAPSVMAALYDNMFRGTLRQAIASAREILD